MNISEVINDIKLTQGLQTIALPFNEPVEVVIKRILQASIRSFSKFKPFIKEGFEERKNLRSPNDFDKSMSIYLLPESLTSTPVQDAYVTLAPDQRTNAEQVTTNAFTVGSPFVGFGSYYPQDILNATLTGAAINKYAGITSKPPTSRWLGFNKVQLYDFPDNCYLQFTVKCNHDENGETIPESQVEAFIQLATLDVQRTLYSQLKNMTNVGGAFKDIQLKIDDWSGAAAERDALIKEWKGVFHFDDLDLVQFF